MSFSREGSVGYFVARRAQLSAVTKEFVILHLIHLFHLLRLAKILNVSRPYLIKLLTEGALPHRKVGKHRRIRMENVLVYKRRIDGEREAVLDELAAQAQETDMGYPHR